MSTPADYEDDFIGPYIQSYPVSTLQTGGCSPSGWFQDAQPSESEDTESEESGDDASESADEHLDTRDIHVEQEIEGDFEYVQFLGFTI